MISYLTNDLFLIINSSLINLNLIKISFLVPMDYLINYLIDYLIEGDLSIHSIIFSMFFKTIPIGIYEYIFGSDGFNWDVQWFIVFILLFIIITVSDFKPISFIEPGNSIIIGNKDSLLSLTLWTNFQDETIKIKSFSGCNFYIEKISDYVLLLRASEKFDEGFLELETTQGKMRIPVKYGLGSDYYYFVPNNVRYFQYEKYKPALVSDVLRGFDSSLYIDIGESFVHDLQERLKRWHNEVQDGKLIRPTAKKYNLPMGLIKSLAKRGIEKRISLTITNKDKIFDNITNNNITNNNVLPITTFPKLLEINLSNNLSENKLLENDLNHESNNESSKKVFQLPINISELNNIETD